MKKLERRLTLPSVVAIAISAMLGAGIFVLPGLAVADSGAMLWLAYLMAGICVLPAAVSKSELATAMPTSGGTYVYIDRTFGPLAGTVAGLGLWLSLLLKSAFALVGFAAYLAAISPQFGAHGPFGISLSLALLALILLINVRGVGKVSKAQVVVMIVSVGGLAAIAVAGGIRFDASNFAVGTGKAGTMGLFAATAFVFVAYNGVTKVAAIAEEIKRPQRNLPLGILLSLLIVTALYTSLTAVLVGNVPVAELQKGGGDEHAIYTLAASFGIHAIGIGAGVLGVLTMTSMANAGVLAASRFPFAMSREGLLPKSLSTVHARFMTPTVAIMVSGIVVALAILFLDVHRMAELASAFLIMLYGAENLAVIVLRESRVQWYKPAFRSPFYPWLQAFGLLSGLGLIVIMVIEDPLISIGAAAVAVPGFVMYLVYGRFRTKRRGVLGQRGRRQDLVAPADATAEEAGDEEARVVVSLFGKERSPEMLVELGDVLADGGKVKVVSITDIPEQTALDALSGEDPRVVSLRRRVVTMGEKEELNVDFEHTVSHDMIKTVNEITRQLHCRWLVMEWAGRTRWTLTVANPLGWLREHIQANLATFHDAGVRYLQKILVFVEPGPHDALVIHTADRL
ncbi:MAG: amino acid permease, partial [Planctomycetes bacterium]|nr:amino acid permease [Planctomycetota bacterium]